WILGDRQVRQGNPADERDDDGKDRRKDRPIDEESRDHGKPGVRNQGSESVPEGGETGALLGARNRVARGTQPGLCQVLTSLQGESPSLRGFALTRPRPY